MRSGGGEQLQQPQPQQQIEHPVGGMKPLATATITQTSTNILDIYSTQSLDDAREKIREGWIPKFAFAATAASPDSPAAYEHGESGATFPTYILVRTE